MTNIRIVTIGDPHLREISDGTANLILIADYLKANNTLFDIVVVLGDYHDLAGAESILSIVGKPVIFVKGNHDGVSSCGSGSSNNGSNVISMNGYQLILVGICGSPSMFFWEFDFNRSDVNKNLPTIIFNHGPIQPGSGGQTDCGSGSSCSNWSAYNGYACTLKVETDKFTNLIAFYAGHVHCYSNQKIGNTLYVTEDNLGGNGPAGDYIGFSCFNNNSVIYTRLNYKTGTTIPNCFGGTVMCDNPVCGLRIY